MNIMRRFRPRSLFTAIACGVLIVFAAAAPVSGQITSPPSSQVTSRGFEPLPVGEDYHVELFGGFWNPNPSILVASEAFGIVGDEIDAVNDLGIERARFTEFRAVLRPGVKHKFRIGYTPITYEADTTLHRSIVFNGIRFNVNAPVTTSIKWHAWRFGYEYDFIYRDRGFVGFIAEAKYTDMTVNLESPVSAEYARARAPIPTVGGIARYYPHRNVGITGELTFLEMPNIDDSYDGSYVDFDIYGTVSFVRNVGVQLGYRRTTVGYLVKEDTGDLRLHGLYFAGVVRF